MKLFLYLVLLGAPISQAWSAEMISSDTVPASRRLSGPGDLESSTTSFVQLKDGSYGIQVVLTSRNGRFAKSNQSAIFTLRQGTIRRENNRLIWSINGEQIVVARHEWYYYPAWQTTPNADLLVNMRKVNAGAWDSYDITVKLEAN